MKLIDQPSSRHEQYEQCDQCGAAVDRAQRYCVTCGTHRRHVYDPAARYLSAAASRSRGVAAPPPKLRSGRWPGLGVALALAVIPLAVGVGVLVGRASTNGDNKLIAALHAQKPEVITTGVAAGTAASTTTASTASPTGSPTASTVSTLTSNFPLQSGYSVQLQTLSAHTSQAAVTKAEHDVASRGAKQTGLILQHDFRVTPSPPAGDYVIYSGAYRTKADADQAHSKLIKQFPAAKVIRVQAAGTSAAPAGKVLAKTPYGSAHQVAGFKATQSQLAAGGHVVSKIQQAAGKSYVNSQRGLPDQISVP
jgi:hypothetical protein